MVLIEFAAPRFKRERQQTLNIKWSKYIVSNFAQVCLVLGETVASTPEREMIQRFAKYVFSREAAEMRESLHESIVEMVLHVKNKPLDRQTIRNEIEHQLGLNFNLSMVNTAIDSLVQKGFLGQRDETFYLMSMRKSVIEKTINARKRSLSDIESRFLSEIHAKVKQQPSEIDETMLRYLHIFLSKLFSSQSKLLLGIIRSSPEDIELVKQYEPPKRIFQSLLAGVADSNLRNAIETAILSIFKKEETARLLEVVARNFLYFQLLNLDPECRLFQRDMFSKKILILDTNFVMAILLISESGHQAAAMCTTASKQLRTQLVYTKRTKREFRDQLQQSHQRYMQLNMTNTDILSSLDDNFIASYALEKKSHPELKWMDFYYRLRTSETILARWGIKELKGTLAPFEVFDEDVRKHVTAYILTCWQGLTGRIKNESVAEHDCYHLLLVRKLREDKPSDALGPQFWFLTFDSSLLCVDKGINETIGDEYELPSSIECWAWMALVAPYIAPEISNEASVKLLSDLMRSQLSLLPARISTKKLIAVQTPKVNYDLFSVEQVKAILSDELVEEYWNRLQNAERTDSPSIEEHRKQLHTRVEEVATSIQRKRAQTEITSRYIAVAASIVLFAFTVYAVFLKEYAGAAILGLLGVVLTAIAVGYSTIEIGIEKIRARLQKS